VVDQGIYSAVVIMVVLTALITPPALTWCFRRAASEPAAAKGMAPVPALAAAAVAHDANGAPHRFLWSAYRQGQPWLSASRAGRAAQTDGSKKAPPVARARPPLKSAG
jgi:hypothetical protein